MSDSFRRATLTNSTNPNSTNSNTNESNTFQGNTSSAKQTKSINDVNSLTQQMDNLTTQEKLDKSNDAILDGPTPHKLFVGQIPPFTSEETLRAHFSPFGHITHLVILKDRFTGAHKGCGFVCYAHRHESDAAIAALADKVRLPNAKREMIVRYAGEKPAETEYKLYVCMLSRSSTENDIRAMFAPYGQLGEVFIIRSREGGASKGAAFVKFLNKQDAEAAIEGLHEKIRDKDAPGLVQVRFAHTKDERAAHLSHVLRHQNANMQLLRGQQLMYAHPQVHYAPYMNAPYVGRGNYPPPSSNAPNGYNAPQPQQFGRHVLASDAYQSNTYNSNANQQQMNYSSVFEQGQGYQSRNSGSSAIQGRGHEVRGPYGANLFIYNLPEMYGEAELGTLFGNFGTVLSTRIQRDPHTGRSRGFGFVSFDSATSAQQAIDALDGFTIGPKKLSVRLKAGSQIGDHHHSTLNTNQQSTAPLLHAHSSFSQPLSQSHSNLVVQQHQSHARMSPPFYDDRSQAAQYSNF